MAVLAAALALFWIILSGKFDLFHLLLGVLSIALSWVVAAKLWRREPNLLANAEPIWRRWPFYLIWLAREIVVSSFQVAYVVLHPRMPVSPEMVRFHAALSHEWAQLCLAHSITLTPGTLTVDVEGDVFLVHALTKRSAAAFQAEFSIARRVCALFKIKEGHG